MRTAAEFPHEDFAQNVCKSVRADHVQTGEHWSPELAALPDITMTGTGRQHREKPMNLKISVLAAPRDERIIHRLQGMTMAWDLPADLEHMTGPRLEIIRQSRLHRYWNFMASTGAGTRRLTWMPVPRSIMDPGSPGWLKASMEPDPERREQVLLELYGMSMQDRIQSRDSMEYTVLNGGRGKTGGRAPARLRQTRLPPAQCHPQRRRPGPPGGHLPASPGGLHHSLPVHPRGHNRRRTGWDPRRKPRSRPARETIVRTQTVGSRAELLEMLPEDTRAAVSTMGLLQETLRIYAERAIWTIAAAQERRWSEAQALRDADKVITEHLETGLSGQKGR